jgi:diguanylate cyclase (GGDEF)-like protein/PAS domain S-box-containing protein
MSSELRPEHLLAAVLEITEEAVLGVDLDGAIVSWNACAARLYGYAAEEVIGKPLLQLMPIYEAPGFREMLGRVISGEKPGNEVVERMNRDGRLMRMTVRRTVGVNQAGNAAAILESGRLLEWSGSDVPAEMQLRLATEQMPGLVWVADRNLRITANWGAGLPGKAIRAGALVGRTVGEFLEAKDPHATPLAEHQDALEGENCEFEYRRMQKMLEIRVAPLRSGTGAITGCIGLATDITYRKESEERIRYQATHDGLTGLANYREFLDTLEREIRRADRSRHPFTVLMLDLNDLKIINDRLGHLEGNRALKRVAAALKEQCRSTDLAGRYGGDEFAVVLIDSDQGMAEHVSERIEASLNKDGQQPKLGVSIGVGVFPDDGRTAQELLQAADQRLYQCKKTSRERRNVAVR